jgi:voltage-gated potassium channel
MTFASLKRSIRRLYEGATPSGVRFRYALLAFDSSTADARRQRQFAKPPLDAIRLDVQVVDGNWGVHAVIKKDIFAGGET